MDHASRMMHYQQAYGMGPMGDHQAASPGLTEDGQDAIRSHADINTILDQIMNITDQSLDEAQVSFLTRILFLSNILRANQMLQALFCVSFCVYFVCV